MQEASIACASNASHASRSSEMRPILQKLREMHLSVKDHEPLKELLQHMQTYIQTGISATLAIPFPALNVNIEGRFQKGRTWLKFAPNKEKT
jgi:hypothetical protein